MLVFILDGEVAGATLARLDLIVKINKALGVVDITEAVSDEEVGEGGEKGGKDRVEDTGLELAVQKEKRASEIIARLRLAKVPTSEHTGS